ncbi:MAG: protein kinase [Lachnospiraceae bacterium]|nr:protein kinase [Lachnospiraceae bacterium]
MFELKDFSAWETYQGAYEGSGRSEKEWICLGMEQIGLFKYPKIDPATGHETTEHISEHIAAQLGTILGVETAKVDIGIRNGRIGSMSYLARRQSETLTEGIGFINRKFPQYNEDSMIDEETGKYYCVDMIIETTKDLLSPQKWIEMLIFDALIGNSDRHQNNWGILEEYSGSYEASTKLRRCPLYDNGSSLCCYVNDAYLDKLFGNDPGPFKALVDSKSRTVVRINCNEKKQPTHKDMVYYLLGRYPDETHKILERIGEALTDEKIDLLMDQYSTELLSSKRNLLIRNFLKSKLKMLKELGGIQ